MNIFRTSATLLRPADARSFSGTAQTKLLASSDDGASVHVNVNAKTDWLEQVTAEQYGGNT